MDIQTSDKRARILADRVRDLAWRLTDIVPPIEAGPAYWLESDSGESYCRHHAIEARAKEFGLGPLIDPDKPSYRHTDLEDAFWDGISATMDGECDSTEHCSVCGEALTYILTNYGFEQEIDHWIACPSEVTTPSDSYALYRLTLNVGHWTKRRELLDCLIVLKRALRTVPKGTLP